MNTLDINDTTQFFIVILLDIGIIFGALGIVFFRKIIYSALLLGLVFVCVALWYLILNADFLAAAQVLIYVGAVNVLIVFAIMLVNKPNNESNKEWTAGDILASSVFFGLFTFLTNMILSTRWGDINSINNSTSLQIKENSLNSIEIIGIHILTDLLLPFELLSVLLLVGLAGAIIIARKEVFKVTYKDNIELDLRKR
jgi:NAD(P)H-quinone oxidoreductase subunit 6